MQSRKGILESFARVATHWTATSIAFALALGSIVVWIFTYPLFDSVDSWQLVINTGTTLVTFLMVFLIQRAQNIESQAVQLKLNELVAAVRGASNRLINIEDLSEEELCTLHKHFAYLAELAKTERKLTHSHSVEEAERRHGAKEEAGEIPGPKTKGGRGDEADHR
jgi:low affinity Fe/Cu permease